MARVWRRWKAAAVLCSLTLCGCNTVAGIGRDLTLLGDGPREKIARDASAENGDD